jgi:hypothetical protein
MIFKWQVTVRLNEVIHKRPDLFEVQFGGGLRFEHRGLVDVFAFAREGRFDHQRLHIDIRWLKSS